MNRLKKIEASPATEAPHAQFSDDEARWRAVQARDAHADGVFWFAVRSTGVYCKPSCPSRPARRDNVSFWPTPAAAARKSRSAIGSHGASRSASSTEPPASICCAIASEPEAGTPATGTARNASANGTPASNCWAS